MSSTCCLSGSLLIGTGKGIWSGIWRCRPELWRVFMNRMLLRYLVDRSKCESPKSGCYLSLFLYPLSK